MAYTLSESSQAVRTTLDLRPLVLHMLVEFCVRLSSGVIVVAGPGAAGKSSLAAELGTALRECGVGACVLDIDCYLRDRQERAALHPLISGYDPAAYRLAQAGDDIADLLAGRTIHVRTYDKIAGMRAAAYPLRPSPIVIVEGSMALQPVLRFRRDLAIYVTADPATLFENRCRREAGYGFTADEINKKYRKLLPDYHAHIVPQAHSADLVLNVDTRYRIVSAVLAAAARPDGRAL